MFARFDAHAVIDPAGGSGCGAPAPPVALLDDAVATRAASARARCADLPPTHWTSGLDRDEYADRVTTVLDLLRAGECYQVNLTRRLTCDDAIDPIALYDALADAHPAPHLALLHLPELGRGTAVVSASPERFLRCVDREVETRPIKGTAATRAALRASSKDRAENVMIVDLARNDLGRVCEPGLGAGPRAVRGRVASRASHHLVSTVRGRLRDDVGLGRAAARHVPARVGHRRAQAARAAGDRGPRAGAPRRLLRRARLDRHVAGDPSA